MKLLPVELWKEIFEHVVEDSQLLDPMYDSQPLKRWLRNPPSSYSRYIPPSVSSLVVRSQDDACLVEDSQLRTKLAIVSTSSQWRKIGLPYLFRRVTFTNLHQLELLTALVRGSRYRYVDGPHNIRLLLEGKGTGYGAMIKRIESYIDCEYPIFIDIVSSL